MTHRRTTSIAIVVLVIACASLAGVSGQQRVEVKDLVKISAENLGVQQCVKPLDDGSQEERSTPRIRFSITNVSDETLIIYRLAPSIFDLRISLRPNDALANSFKYDEPPTFNCAPPFIFGEEPAPTNAFRLLPPGESFTYEPNNVTSYDKSPYDAKRRFEGDYFIRFRVATWYWDLEKAKMLKQRWAPYGRLFYSNLVTDAIPITFSKPGPETPRCDTASLK